MKGVINDKIDAKKKGVKYPKICMITGPLPDSIVDADIVHISSLLRLLEPLAEKIFIISSNLPENQIINDEIRVINIKHRSDSRWMFIRIPKYVLMQLKISYHIIRKSRKIDIVLFSIGATPFFLPTIFARLMRKKVILLHVGVGVVKEYAKVLYRDQLKSMGWQIYPTIAGIFEEISCNLSNKIVVYSQNSDQFLSKRYINKISMDGSRFYVDSDHFIIKKNIDARTNLIGYVGKFFDSKGVMNILKAIPTILGNMNKIKFIFCGEGPLRDNIEEEIRTANLNDTVTITRWISHEELPHYLNEMKLLIIASDTEVGPQILFEAMACGTPVLATPVGVVLDVIKDGETGFIMENNSPECIAENIIRALEHPNLNEIVRNAMDIIEEKYSYEAAVERYRKILESAGGGV